MKSIEVNFNKQFCIMVILMGTWLTSFSQTPDGRDTNYGLLQNYQTPEVATFNTYGSIPVSLYTGTPNISVPLYTLKEQGLEVPIQLNYNINNVKPNIRPGIVGLGWNLFAGGSITRIQKGNLPDEFAQGYLINHRRLSDAWFDDYCMTLFDNCNNYNYLEQKPWYDKYKLHIDAKLFRNKTALRSGDTKDISPDIFNFNFLGYSGSFILNENNQWVVNSETAFKVEHQMMTYRDTKDIIKTALNTIGIQSNDWDTNTFEKFILTAPDGMIFEFGGKSAIDYSTAFFNRLYMSGYDVFPVATSWHLSKIRFVNGTEIKFEYMDSAPNLEGNFTFWIQSNYNNNFFGRNLNFQIVLPVLLERIISPDNTTVQFKYKESVQLGYRNNYFDEFGSSRDIDLNRDNQVAIIDNEASMLKPLYVTTMYEFKWSQLDEIILPNNTYYKLGFTETTSQRLKLNSITRKNQNSNQCENYLFYYNETSLPEYLSGFYDHLGFYNGENFDYIFKPSFYFKKYGEGILQLNPNAVNEMKQNANAFYNSRHGDKTGVWTSAEMLNKIVYPTGGFSEFYYEPHHIDGVVSEDRLSVTPVTSQSELSTPGGVRISQIKNFSNQGEFINGKKYEYNAGILAFTPKYFWNLSVLRDYPKDESQYIPSIHNDSVNILTSGSTNQAYSNMEGSVFVGYSKVKEYSINSNGETEGHKEYRYTNFSNGYFDERPLQNLNQPTGYSNSLSPYSPYISHSKKRGRLVSEEFFDKDLKLLKGTYFAYRSTDIVPVRDELLFSLRNKNEKIDGTFEDYPGIYTLGGIYLHKLYQYLLDKKETKTIINSDTITELYNYTYNKENKIVSERFTISPTDTRETMTIYSGDLFQYSVK